MEINETLFFKKCIKNQNFPRNDALKQIILKNIMKNFELNKIYTEQEVNEIIKIFFKDYSLIRRELVNFGYMQRDPFKQKYSVIKKKLSKEDYLKISSLKRHAKDLGII